VYNAQHTGPASQCFGHRELHDGAVLDARGPHLIWKEPKHVSIKEKRIGACSLAGSVAPTFEQRTGNQGLQFTRN